MVMATYLRDFRESWTILSQSVLERWHHRNFYIFILLIKIRFIVPSTDPVFSNQSYSSIWRIYQSHFIDYFIIYWRWCPNSFPPILEAEKLAQVSRIHWQMKITEKESELNISRIEGKTLLIVFIYWITQNNKSINLSLSLSMTWIIIDSAFKM